MQFWISSAVMPPVVATWTIASRSQHSSANATRTFATVARDFQSIGVPSGIGLIDGDAPAVTAFLMPFAFPLEQQPVHFHDVVDALGIGCCVTVLLCLAAQKGMDVTIAVGGQIGAQQADVSDRIGIGQRRSSSRSWRPSGAHLGQMRASDAESYWHILPNQNFLHGEFLLIQYELSDWSTDVDVEQTRGF